MPPAACAGLENNALPLLDEFGNVVGWRGVARDITQHRLQQERIARLSRIQAVLSGINSTIVRVRERRELLRESCRIAVQQGGFRMAWMGMVEPGAMKAAPLVWDGLERRISCRRWAGARERQGAGSGRRGAGDLSEENGGRERHRDQRRTLLRKARR